MMPLRRALCLIFALGLLGARPVASPTPLPAEVAGVHRLVVSQFLAWQTGSLDRTRYSADFNAQIGDAQVQRVALKLDTLGAFERAEYLGPLNLTGAPAGTASYIYRMHCANGTVEERISLDRAGRIAGILFADLRSASNPE